MVSPENTRWLRFAKQQITLDEYKSKAQDSVKLANERTAEVSALWHMLST